ncbi:MAG: hypothetical protein VZR02_04500 [Lachnospiraceae bacterium]|nr:hypothetical protein [Lachnospiraceae bacterium]
MNLVSILIVAVIAVAFVAAFIYTRKNGSCSECGSAKGGCTSCGSGSCSHCSMGPLERQQEEEYRRRWQETHPEAVSRYNKIRKA